MKTAPKPTLTLLAVLGLAILVPSPAQASTWYWRGSNTSDALISTIAKWNTDQSGSSGTAATSFNSGDTYDANGGTRILLDVGTNKVFPGGLVIMNASSMSLKASSPGTNIQYTFAQVEAASTGATLALNSGSSNGGKINLTNLNLLGQLTFSNAYANATYSLTANIGNVTGDGSFYFKANASTYSINFTVADASLTNAFTVEKVNLVLNSDFASTAQLLLKSDSLINLNSHSVAFSSVTDGTNSLADGTYTAGDLASTPFAGYFAGAGSITVSAIPEPSACALLLGGLTLGFAGIRRKRTAGR